MILQENDTTREIKSKWVQIQYDYIPKYYKNCCLQGHDVESCWNIHPELYDKKQEASGEAENNKKEEKQMKQGEQ